MTNDVSDAMLSFMGIMDINGLGGLTRTPKDLLVLPFYPVFRQGGIRLVLAGSKVLEQTG